MRLSNWFTRASSWASRSRDSRSTCAISMALHARPCSLIAAPTPGLRRCYAAVRPLWRMRGHRLRQVWLPGGPASAIGSDSPPAYSAGNSAPLDPSGHTRRSRAAVLQAAQKQLSDLRDAVVNAAPVDSAAAPRRRVSACSGLSVRRPRRPGDPVEGPRADEQFGDLVRPDEQFLALQSLVLGQAECLRLASIALGSDRPLLPHPPIAAKTVPRTAQSGAMGWEPGQRRNGVLLLCSLPA
jgi:hypothetical protein